MLAVESAQCLIGMVMVDNSRYREVGHVRPDQLFDPFHARIWAAIGDLVSAGRRADAATIADLFAADPSLIEFGGARHIADLIDKAPSYVSIRPFAETVVSSWARREAAAVLADGARDVMTDLANSPGAMLSAIRNRLDRLEQDASSADGELATAADACDSLLDSLEHEAAHGRERGCMTGVRCFDRRMRGLRPGWLVVLGGRPSMGKSGLMRSAAYGAAKRNPDKTFLIFSLEMDARECAERALSAATFEAGDGIPYNEFGSGLAPHERARLRGFRAGMPANVLIDDRSNVSLDDIARRVWAVKARQPVGGVFVDYLQLMARPDPAGRNDALVLGDITRGLKTLAREAETCVVLLSQLNRQVENREDKRPQLADLRDSGSIEQDANAVLFPYREVYYRERAEPKDTGSAEHLKWQESLELIRRRMDVIAAKVRGGAIGTDRQAYYAECDHVEDVPQDADRLAA